MRRAFAVYHVVCALLVARVWPAFALGSESAKLDQNPAIRTKCDCKLWLRAVPANCMQSASRRRHSSACFRDRSGSDTAYLVKAPPLWLHVLNVLSVVCATEQSALTGALPARSGQAAGNGIQCVN
jgi:hypothetical protein